MASILALKLKLVSHEGPKRLLGSIFDDFALKFDLIFDYFVLNANGFGKHFKPQKHPNLMETYLKLEC